MNLPLPPLLPPLPPARPLTRSNALSLTHAGGNPWAWLTATRMDAPDRRFKKAGWSRQKPPKKSMPLQQILPSIYGLRTDDDVEEFLFKHRSGFSLINYGSSWCTHCHEMFPHMIKLSEMFPGIAYAVGQLDYLSDSMTKDIEYSPTFSVYSKGNKKVDQFHGNDKQRLADHVWLWSGEE